MDAANYTYQALNQQKLLSVVVPVFNRAPMLKTCLESIRLQNYRPLELILVDNASEDQRLQICRDYQQQYRSEDFNIVVLQETKKGACAARNKGYATREHLEALAQLGPSGVHRLTFSPLRQKWEGSLLACDGKA